MRMTIEYVIGALFAFIIVGMTFFMTNSQELADTENYSTFDNDWTCVYGSRTIEYKELPDTVEDYTEGSIILKKIIPNSVESGDCLAFYCAHQFVTIKIDNEVVFKVDIPENVKSTTPGVGWHFCDLDDSYANKMLTVEISSNYNDIKNDLVHFYFGDEGALYKKLVSQRLIPTVVDIMIIFIGIILIVIYICIGRVVKGSKSVLWLGVFSLIIGIWSGIETELCTIIFGRQLLFSRISFITLYMLAVPLVLFNKEVYGKYCNRFLLLVGEAWCICSTSLIILQCLNICDMRRFVFLCVPAMAVIATVMLVLSTITLRKKKKNGDTNKLGYVISLYVLIVAILVDVCRYLFAYQRDAAKFIRIGFLVYVIALSITMVQEIINNYYEYEKYTNLEEEALHDALTKIYNRTAFEKDCFNTYSVHPEDYSVAMMDLNYLKYFNDVHGHDEGDHYIIVCSEILEDIFDQNHGAVLYRIGGDEFCAVMKDVSEKTYKQMIKEMKKKIAGLSDMYFDSKMGIAAGYARFDQKKDIRFKDMIKRADAKMYADKKIWKSEL